MFDDDRTRIVGDYIAELNNARRLAGTPSYPRLERTSRRLAAAPQPSGVPVLVLARSTANDILTGRRRGLPQWEWVACLWRVLQVLAPDDRKEQLGTLRIWRARHEAAEAALRQLDSAGRHSGQTTHAFDSEEDRRADLLRLAAHDIGRSWWHEYRDLVPERCRAYMNLEPVTDLIRSYETWFVPGLLQTPAYAESVIRHFHPTASEVEIERRLALRMRRQRILDLPVAPRLWTIIDEEALHQQFGDAHIMRHQIEHLIALSAHPRITIQIMPLGSGNHAATDGPITLLRFPQPDHPDVIYLEHLTGGIYPNTRTDVYYYNQILSRLAIDALRPAVTVPVLRRIHRQA